MTICCSLWCYFYPTPLLNSGPEQHCTQYWEMGAFLCKLLCISLHVNSIDGWVLYQEFTAPYILCFVLVTFHCYVIAPDKDGLREESN